MQTLNKLSREGVGGYSLPKLVVPKQKKLPKKYLRSELKLPELSEPDVTREFMSRASVNTSVDNAPLYPLGSCTMIYNPMFIRTAHNDFSNLHPLQPTSSVQGALSLLYDLEQVLSEMGGAVQGTLQPAAGAHSELTSLLMIEKYFKSNCDGNNRKVVLTPDSAHGTNPSSAVMAGYGVREIPSNKKTGRLDICELEKVMSAEGENVAALMITQPSTFGIYDECIKEITEIMHRKGAQVYADGANFAAISNRVKFGDLGIDIFHFNLHKTFGVPHGGGGPGAGYVGVAEHLVPFLPVPIVEKDDDNFILSYDKTESIGTVSSAYGNFLADVMAYSFIKLMGSDGFREVSGIAVLTGNYMHHLLKDILPEKFPGLVAHEGIVCMDSELKNLSPERYDGREKNLSIVDLVKPLLDEGFYAPTVGFPIHDGILTEPTFTASKENMDKFVDIMDEIIKRSLEEPEWLANAPYKTAVSRIKEAESDRNPVFIYPKLKE